LVAKRSSSSSSGEENRFIMTYRSYLLPQLREIHGGQGMAEVSRSRRNAGIPQERERLRELKAKDVIKAVK
jgi:hypothetical protein